MEEFDKIKYNNAYNRENYKIVSFRVKKSIYDEVGKLAKKKGFHTINAFAKFLFEEELQKQGIEENKTKIEINGGNVGNIGNVDTIHVNLNK